MNTEQIREVFEDVNARVNQEPRLPNIHRDFDMEKDSDAIAECKIHNDTLKNFDVRDEYVTSEYKSWKREMKSLVKEDRYAILSTLFSKILIGGRTHVDVLTPKQKVFYHAGIRLFEMKVRNNENRNNGCSYNHIKRK